MSNRSIHPDSLKRISDESFVAKIDYHVELSSTNDRALELVEQGNVQSPLLVIAESQTAGRGRGNNQWWSADGALTFSLVLHADHVDLPPERRPQISLTAGLGVCEALAEIMPGHNFSLKWPNDVYLGRKKVCGILVEVPPRDEQHFVVGIGINVNNSFNNAPADLRSTATSLFDEAGEECDRVEILLRVLQRLAEALDLLTNDPGELTKAFSRRCLLSGRTVHLQAGANATIGRCLGIAGDGALLIETDSGLRRAFGGVIARFE